MDNELAAACEATIGAVHRFFEDWFRGTRPNTDAVWDEIERALAPNFVLVAPGGQVLPRATLMPALRGNYAQHASRRFEIEVRNVGIHHETPAAVVAGYEEWQRLGEVETARHSTAVFARTPEGSTNLRWVHVQETWLPGKSPPQA